MILPCISHIKPRRGDVTISNLILLCPLLHFYMKSRNPTWNRSGRRLDAYPVRAYLHRYNRAATWVFNNVVGFIAGGSAERGRKKQCEKYK
jgi:hypothetical protein